MYDQQNDPSKYKWGIFYYDPEDPRVFIPKNIRSLGFTLNFANPDSWLIIGAIIIFAITISYLSK